MILYSSLLLYNIYIISLINKYNVIDKKDILWLLFASLITFFFSYIIICDPNPIIGIITYYIFFPNFFKAILIIIFHTYFFSKYYKLKNYNYINNLYNNNHGKIFKKDYLFNRTANYFLSDTINYFKKNKNIFVILLIIFFLINIILFVNRIKIWIYLNSKEKTLPIASSKNTTFYITAMIANMEGIITNFIEEMKKLINYLAKENIILSIVENGDSKDKTRYFLRIFKT